MRKFLLVLFAFAFALSAMAQERTVSGKVTSADDGAGLPGVNVILKGTSNGTVTDGDGNYKLSVPAAGGTLVFSFIGFQTFEAEVGERSVVDAGLQPDVKELTEIVVTAQGVERDQRALGYATSTISSSTLNNKPETDLGRALQGRTPGLQILNSSGLAGSGSRINIRGNSSITGNTQPLWVVNGVPINTDQRDINSDFQDGQISPTRFLDLDPNNIASISVLRGLNATTLYGAQGRNGVILVTTKTGTSKAQTRKFEATLAQSYFVVNAVLPEYQNKWANGFDGAYGEFFSNWGSLFDGKPTQFRHPYYEWKDLFPQYPEFGVAADDVQPGQTVPGYIPVAAPNNVKDFFRTGSSSTTSLTLGARGDLGNMSFSYSHLDEDGFIENNNLKRDNFSFGGTANLTEKLTFRATFNFVRTDFKTPPTGAGYGSNTSGAPSVFTNIFYTPRNIDLMNWPFENPVDHSMVYYRNDAAITNPRWLLYNSQQTDLTNRFFSSSQINYKFTDWINATYRLGYDTYSDRQTYWNNKGGGNGFDDHLTPGAYRSVTGTSDVIDHNFIVSMNKDLSTDLNLNGIVGYNWRRNTYSQEGLESLGQVVYGLIEHRNFTATQARDWRGYNLNYQENSTIQGVYFDANLGFKNMLYVGITGRNDWSSALQEANRSQFYPGANISFIPTAAFPGFGGDFMDFLKIRLAYGTSANFGDPYNVSPYLTLNSQSRVDGIGNVVTSRQAALLANPDLQPELLKEIEAGIETNMMDNKIKLNLSFYNRISSDQIIYRPLDPSTGFTGTYINAGEITNKGIEASLTVVPIRNSSIVWDLTLNFTKNISKVESLPEGSKEILINGFSNIGNFAIEGQPMNVIQGSYTLRAPDGQEIINDVGNYKVSDVIGVIGDPNPNWMASLITSVTWKAFTLGMQWDYVNGGQVLSYTAQTMIGRGVGKDLENFDPTLPLILPGVQETDDGSGNLVYTPNTIPITTAGVFFDNSIVGTGAYDRGIYEASRIRFREISLSYSLPASLVSKLKMQAISVMLVGNNLWWRAFNAPEYSKADFDRTAFGSNNGAGFDFMGGPSATRIGGTIKITF